jgi:hypothetical protein
MKQALLIILTLLLTACAPTLKMEQNLGNQQVSDEKLPRQVAILPFVNGTDEPEIDKLVRRTFANHFAAKNYQDLKLPVVDEKLVQFEKASGKKAAEASPRELAAALGCDGLIYGRVIDYKRVYAAVYSQFGVETEIWMVNAKTGKEVFRIKKEVRYHEGGIPTSPLSIVVTVVSTAMNLRDIQKVRLVNELSYKLTEQVPGPKSLGAEARPAIKEVLTNAAEGPFGVRKVIKAGLEGEPGLVATFDIGTFRKGVPMKEVKPGIYAGDYAVLPGDSVRDMPVTVTLSRPGGYETQWLDGSAYLTIDTTPPPRVTGVKAKGLSDRVQLQWSGITDVTDLKGYRVLRSDQPLTGYTELAVVEVPRYEEIAKVSGIARYYRVVAFDQAGNESEATDAVAATPVSLETESLAGEIRQDRTLAGNYLVQDMVVVPRGVTLAISPGTRLRFEKDAGLAVSGRLIAKGDDEGTVEFVPAGKERWQGLVFKGASVELARARVRGAVSGLSLSETKGAVLDTQVLESGTGLSVSGVSGLEIKGCTLSGNEVGASLQGSDALLVGNSLVQNGDGITLEGFTGELRDNNIFGNTHNLASASPVHIGANFFGSERGEEMLIAGLTPALVYNARVPGGKLVAPLSDPYAGLAAEERARKGTEMVVEAGGYFRSRNFGKAVTLFEEARRATPSPEITYYLSLCYRQMGENERAVTVLKEGVEEFPREALLWKSLGMLSYETGNEAAARKELAEAVRLSPDDRQSQFVLEKVSGSKKP